MKHYQLKNGHLMAVIDENGMLLKIEDTQSGRTLLENTRNENFMLKLDPFTSDIWKTDLARESNVHPTAADAITEIYEENGILTAKSVINRNAGVIVLKRHYTFENNRLTVTSEIENKLKTGVIIAAIPLYITGMIGKEKPLSAVWPFKTGVICKDGFVEGSPDNGVKDILLQEDYPTPISMQYAAFFDESACLYCAVEDMTAEFKTFFYRSGADQTASFWCEQMPFIAPGEAKTLFPTVIAVLDGGGWTDAADMYREFLKKAGWIKPPQKSAVEYTGSNLCGLCLNRDKQERFGVKYTADSPILVERTLKSFTEQIIERTGFDWFWIAGWHIGGFDTYYPDFKFFDSMGGEAEFQKGVQQVKDLGCRVQAYINVHMSDKESQWYNTVSDDGRINGERCAIRKANGGVWEEYYPPAPPQDVAMCPMADNYRKALTDAVRRLRKAGVDALYLDQLSEMRSQLCFDPSHGHRTPATAYYEGYTKILNEISAIMEEGGSDYFFCCEGECDCWGKWVDVFYGLVDTNFLPMSRYTMPSKIIGRDLIPVFYKCYGGETEDNANYFSAAFVLGQPFTCHEYHVKNTEEFTHKNLKRYLALYKKYPDIFLAGTYQYHIGVSGEIPVQIDYGVMLADNGNRASVQLYNRYGETPVSFTFHYTPKVGSVKRAYNAETGENMLSETGEISLTLDPKTTAAVVLEW